VFLLTDGLAAEWLERRVTERRFLASSAPEAPQMASGLVELSRRGTRARWMQPVNPPLTAPAMLALLTGAPPKTHGVPANWFLVNGVQTHGFDAPLRAEPLWLAARRAAKRTLTVDVPGADCRDDKRRGERSICYAKASQIVPASPDVTVALDGQGRGALAVGAATVEVRASSDTSIVLQGGPTVETGADAEVVLRGKDGRTVAAQVILRSVDRTGRKVRLYVGAATPNTTWPPELGEELAARGLHWPIEADSRHYRAHVIDDGMFERTFARQRAFVPKAVCSIASAQDDLIILYIPTADMAGHNLLDHPDALERALRALDADLASLVRCLDDGKTSFVLAADHGMAREYQSVDLQAVLRTRSIAATVAPGGGSARVYVRDPAQVAVAEKVIAEIIPGTHWWLDGDAYTAQAPVGTIFVSLGDAATKEAIRGPATIVGAHGHSATDPSMRAALLIAPAGRTRGAVVQPVDQLQVAATVAKLLGIAPPTSAKPALARF
jgi:predicted AlkP superfamily pyrophosphatase or phosphodiesterase